MSLRTEMREALDEVIVPAPTLSSKVEAAVAGEIHGRSATMRRRRWTIPVRVPLSLAAAAVIVALIGGLIVGGRLFRETTTPTPLVSPEILSQLEARPLRLPAFGPECPVSPLTDVSAHGQEFYAFGEGPVYALRLGYQTETTNWGTWSEFAFEVDAKEVAGPLLVRARDLQTGASVVFALIPHTVIGQAGYGIPTGRVIRTDAVFGTQLRAYTEVVYDLSRPYPVTSPGNWPIFKTEMGYPKGGAGCIGFQIDGPKFTEVVVPGA